jgi:cytosine/adenosine deaminase-related metal-dependent hydrolase
VTIATDGSAPRFSHDLWKDIVRAMWHQWVRYGTQQVLPPGKALRMVTIDAARALGMGEEIGSLEVGKKADVILVDFDRLHLTPKTFVPQLLTYYVNGNDVDTVIVDGKVLMEEGQILSVDVEEVMESAREEAARAFERVDLSPYTDMGRAFWHGARY